MDLHELEERLLPHWLPGDHNFDLMLTMVMIVIIKVMVNIYLMMMEMPDWSK